MLVQAAPPGRPAPKVGPRPSPEELRAEPPGSRAAGPRQRSKAGPGGGMPTAAGSSEDKFITGKGLWVETPWTEGCCGQSGGPRDAGHPGRPRGRGSGVQEAVEGVVGRLQVKQHLAHLGVIQLVGRRHAAQGLQPGGWERWMGGCSQGRRGPQEESGTHHWLTVWRPSKSGGRWLMRCIVSINSRRSGWICQTHRVRPPPRPPRPRRQAQGRHAPRPWRGSPGAACPSL